MHDEELHKLYPSPNIIRIIKSRDEQGMYHAWGKDEYLQGSGAKARRKEATRKT
jgi:hypothetical protein